MQNDEWTKRARGVVKGELARRDISYTVLAERLRGMGIDDTPQNLSNKINRGTFSAAFFLQVMHAIGVRRVDLDFD